MTAFPLTAFPAIWLALALNERHCRNRVLRAWATALREKRRVESVEVSAWHRTPLHVLAVDYRALIETSLCHAVIASLQRRIVEIEEAGIPKLNQ